MGHTLVTYLSQVRDGRIFHETFENDNFIQAQGWTSIAGNPSNTSNQYNTGIKSFLCRATDTIRYTNTDIQSPLQTVSFWFWDDPTQTTQQGPYIKVKFSNGWFVQVGIRNGTDSTHWSTNTTNDFAEDHFAASAVARTAGWTQIGIQIWNDGTIRVYNLTTSTLMRTHSTAPLPLYVSQVSVCSNTLAGTGDSFGYVDDVYIFHGQSITVQQVPGLYAQFLTAAGLDGEGLALGSLTTGIIKIYQPAETSGYLIMPQGGYATKMACWMPLTDFYPGDIYQYNKIDLGRRVEKFPEVPIQLGPRNETAGGQAESFKLGLKNKLSFTINNLQGIAFKQQVDNWYYHAAQGLPFSFLVDTDHAGMALVTADTNPSGETPSPTLSVVDNALLDKGGFEVGRQYVIRGASNFYKQVVTLAAIGPNPPGRFDPGYPQPRTLTFTEPLRQAVSPGDFVHDAEFYPFMELGTSPYGLSITKFKTLRFQWNQTIQDYNG